MAEFLFGTGLLTITPPGSNPTPVQIGTLQEVSVLEPEFATKELYGAYQFAVAIARTTGKLTGKIKAGQINGALVAALLAGSTINTGSIVGVPNEVGIVPSTPYQVTVTQSAQFSADLGVYDATSSLMLTRVASSPATGQYAVTAGVYTFASSDVGHVMWISYSYTSAAGKTIAYSNQIMGSGTVFGITFWNRYQGGNFGVKLYAAMISKLSLPFKNDDFAIANLDFQAYAAADGKIADIYTSE